MPNMINTISKSATVNRTNLVNGLMPVQAANRFIDFIFQDSPLLSAIRTVKMPSESMTLAGILENKGQTRFVGANNAGTQADKDSEDQSSFRRSLSSYSFDLTSKELSLSRTVSNKIFQDSIEGEGFNSRMAKHLAEMVRVDIEDSGINSKAVDTAGTALATLSNAPGTAGTTFQVGATQPAGFPIDGSQGHGYLKITKGGVTELVTYGALVDSAGTWEFQNCVRAVTDEDGQITSTAINLAISDTISWQKHHLKGVLNGFIELVENPQALSSVIVDGSAISAGAISYSHFSTALTALAKKYRSQNLVYILSLNQIEKYRNWLLTNHSQTFAGQIISDSNYPPIKSITPVDWPEDKILLTNPKNLVLGVHSAIRMRKVTADTDSKLADTDETYYNIRLRAGFSIERPDACVLVNGLV